MKTWSRIALLSLCSVALGVSLAGSQAAKDAKKERPRALVSLYRIAPGKHLEFLKWLADQEAAAKEAGVAPSQLYAHTDGDAWDYVVIAPVQTAEQDAKVDEVLKKKGMKTGFASGLEFRQFAAWHTDTFVVGPTTAADLVKAAAE